MIEEIRKLFFVLEKDRFTIVNNYIMGIISIQEVTMFGQKIEKIRNLLDNFQTNDENLLEIAKYKSKIQHFYTEIMEDEELLRMAYSNNL